MVDDYPLIDHHCHREIASGKGEKYPSLFNNALAVASDTISPNPYVS